MKPPKKTAAKKRLPTSGPKKLAGALQKSEVELPLRALLDSWVPGKSEVEVRALGMAALELILDCLDGKIRLARPQEMMEYRDYGDPTSHALVAFAEGDLPDVLRKLAVRGWSDLRIAATIGGVRDSRIVPYLLTAFADKDGACRRQAVTCLASQRDERATDALIAAINDRAGDVRYAAIEGLGEVGDPRAIEPLRVATKRSARFPWLGHADQAIRKIREKARAQGL